MPSVSKQKYIYRRKEKPHNYLKYHRLIMAMARKRFGVSTKELDMLFFLYDEHIFTRTTMFTYQKIMPFDRMLIERFIERGLIRTWRNEVDYRNPLYELTRKGSAIVHWVYQRMNGEVEISETSLSRDMMRKTNGKLSGYSIVIREMAIRNKKMREAERRKTITPDL